MAATVKHTTILVVVQAFVHLHVEAAQLGLNREKAKSARYDKEKFGIHLDTLQGRNQAAETFREVETPLEKQLQYTNFNRKIENSKLWQEFKTRLNTAKLGLQRTDPLLKLDNDRPILNYRVKRKTKLSEKQQEKLRTDQQFRAKREVVIHPQLKPEMVMQPRIEMPMEKEAEEKRQNVPLNFHFYNPSIYYPEVIDSLANKSGSYQEKLSQNREKRQVLYLLDGRGVPLLFRPVRTTPNPFIRQTNIEDYEIVRPNLGEEFRPIAGDDADSDSSDVESSYQLKMAQVLSWYLRNIKFQIGQSYPIQLLSFDKSKDYRLKEDKHVRVKRKMSRFRRDRKQITRKKKIGRRKKTKVRRAPIKKRRWYDKRQKGPKKGDGTYRGGRGRKPRQHKRPRHYKPPQNETSDYDYYDAEGKARFPSEETAESSDDIPESGEDEEESDEYEGDDEEEENSDDGENEYDEDDDEDEEEEDEEEEEEEEEEEDSDDVEESDKEISNSHDSSGEKDSSYKKQSNKKHSKIDNKESRQHVKNQETKKKAVPSKSNEDQLSKKKNNIFNSMPPQIKLKRGESENRLTAKRLNLVSLSSFPNIRNSVSLNHNQPPNKMSSVQFETPQQNVYKNLQSGPQKRTPDIVSLKNAHIVSNAGEPLHNLQSKRMQIGLQSTSRDKKLSLTSVARDKSDTHMTFTSQRNDERIKLTSINEKHQKNIQSLAIEPLVLTSIAKHIPQLMNDDIKTETTETINTKGHQDQHRPTRTKNGA
ncbi:uncharacterized protein PF13_0277-like isoform X2 [Homalodisca vitripennis]|uniref:uncharacterized protein PF13_0277-like isoform X2 n=1 Tax=Homalodisca vitripennis TaxID=197043 RepID=UPI001EEA47C1|nr:uncharacterized protein PF13_0277-like isoform X2 [Homalodisca vitripennis]